MTDAVRITNFPDSGSKERVALDLATKISPYDAYKPNPSRGEWLELYAECLRVVNGGTPR